MRLTRRGALLLPLGLAARPARAAGAAWRIVTEYPATAIPGEGIGFFAESVSRLSGRALAVVPGYEAMRSAAMLPALAEKRVEAADAFTGALGTEAPIFQLSALPFLTGSAEDTVRLLRAARPAYQAALSGRGLTLLYATPWPATGIWSRRPLDGADAVRGLRIRTYDAASTAVFTAAGAAPAAISFVDALPRVRSGEMDAVLSSGDGGAGARLWEALPFFTALNYASPLSLAFCRTEALDALSESEREAVWRAAQDTEARQFTAIGTRATENEERMRANGVSIAPGTALRPALVEAAAPVIADWLSRAGEAGAKALTAYRG